ncbi:MAG: DUF2937 family protein, partial [Pseudomonadota bacterium]
MLGKILAFILGVAGLLAGSQAPNFTNNFMQNLEGRVDERRLDFERITERWDYYGIEEAEVLDNCNRDAVEGSNPQASCQEDVLIVKRYNLLSALQGELQEASIWERPILLGKSVATGSCKVDGDAIADGPAANTLETLCVRYLAKNTLEEFKPAVPVTADGFAYGAGGGF